MPSIPAHQFETRALIVKHVVAVEGLTIDEAAARAIAALVVTDSLRELEGAVIRVVAYASFSDQPITTELAGEVLANRRYGPQPVVEGEPTPPPRTPFVDWLIEKGFKVDGTTVRREDDEENTDDLPF